MKQIKIIGTMLNENQWGLKRFTLKCNSDSIRIKGIENSENSTRISFRIFTHDDSYSNLYISETYRDYDSEGYECGPIINIVPNVYKPGYGIVDFSFTANTIVSIEIKDIEEEAE